MRRVLALSSLLAVASLCGCAAAVIGTAGAVGINSLQEKTLGEAVDDATTSSEIKAKLLNESG
ncbi:MAG: phospholipid-binding protein, partial [Hyphomonas sp.]